jgi:hypothetical protein
MQARGVPFCFSVGQRLRERDQYLYGSFFSDKLWKLKTDSVQFAGEG